MTLTVIDIDKAKKIIRAKGFICTEYSGFPQAPRLHGATNAQMDERGNIILNYFNKLDQWAKFGKG